MLQIGAAAEPIQGYDLSKPHMRVGGFANEQKRQRFTWIVQGGRVWENGSQKFLGTVADVLKKKFEESMKAYGHSMCELCGRIFPQADGEVGLEGHMYYDHREMLIASVSGISKETMAASMPDENKILQEAARSAGLVSTEPEKEPVLDRTKPAFKQFEKGTLVK